MDSKVVPSGEDATDQNEVAEEVMVESSSAPADLTIEVPAETAVKAKPEADTIPKPVATPPSSPAKSDKAQGIQGSPSKAKIAMAKKNDKMRNIPPNPPGFHANVIKHIGDDDVLGKMQSKLLDGEEIMDSFNVHFETGMMPMYKVYGLLFVTFGLALFYFAYRASVRWLVRKKWLHPKLVGFKRSVMIVTSYGRVLVWSVEAEQRKDGDMVKYNKNPYAWGTDYKTWLKLMVDCFKVCTMNYKLINMVETCAPPMSYTMTTLMAVYHLKDLRQLSVLSAATSPCGICCCCPLFTSQIAMCFTGATDEDVSYDFSELGVGIESVTGWSATINSILNGDSDDHNGEEKGKGILQTVRKPDVIYIDVTTNKNDKVHESAGATIVEELSTLATQILAHNKTLGQVFDGENVDDNIIVSESNATIVHNDGSVTIPASYFPLLPGERILQVHGQIYRAKFMQWIYAILTLGFWYFYAIRPKRYNRTAFIVTTHRIAEIIISQREGCVPSHGANYAYGARSFFPRTVTQAGYIARSKNRVTGGIMTDFGPLQMTFDMFGRRDVFMQFLKFYAFFQTSSGDYPLYQMKEPEEKPNLTGVEKSVIQLTPGEFVVGRFQGTNKWRPLPFLEKCCNTDVCCYPLYPWGAWLMTCSLRPKRQVSAIIVTNRTIYFMSSITNYTCESMAVKDSFSLTYAPLADFVGVATTIESKGKEWCARRMWQWICCCNYCRSIFPIAKHQFTMKGVISSGIHILVGGGPMAFHPVDDINNFDMLVARVQKAIWDHTPHRNALVPVKSV